LPLFCIRLVQNWYLDIVIDMVESEGGKVVEIRQGVGQRSPPSLALFML